MAAVAGGKTKVTGEEKAFGGTIRTVTHFSKSTNCEMVFRVFVPKAGTVPAGQKFPVIYYLAGLTCTPNNFTEKAGAFAHATRLGVALVMPDTSPRGKGVADDEGWDLGQGAGFYLTATEAPWKEHYNMYGYVTEDLPAAVQEMNPEVDTTKASIMGHSMGGHGALTIALKNPGKYAAVSAFAPICNPCQCPWGDKAFGAYLGSSEETKAKEWPKWDACELVKSYPSKGPLLKMLVSQGTADGFLKDEQLQPEHLRDAVAARSKSGGMIDLTINMEEGYTHGYFFIATFVEQHIKFHAQALGIIVD